MYLLFFMIFAAFSFSANPDKEITVVGHKPIIIYVDTVVQNGQNLKLLLPNYAMTHRYMIKQRMSSFSASPFNGHVYIYDDSNVAIINHKKCDYKKNAMACSTVNSHWYMKGSIFRDDLKSVFMLRLYDDRGIEVSSASISLYGHIELVPQFKKTTIKENSMFGSAQREILEQYPPKRLKHQPKVDGRHVSDAMMKLFLSIDQQYIIDLNLDKK